MCTLGPCWLVVVETVQYGYMYVHGQRRLVYSTSLSVDIMDTSEVVGWRMLFSLFC